MGVPLYLEQLQEASKVGGNLISVTENQASSLLGKDYKTCIKTMEMAVKQKASKLTDKKVSFKVSKIYLNFGAGEKPGVIINGQGKLSGSGALDISAFIPIKTGTPKFRPIEVVGRI